MLYDPTVTRYDPRRGLFSINFHPQLAVRLRYSSWADGVQVQRYQRGTWEEEPDDPQLPLIHGQSLTCRPLAAPEMLSAPNPPDWEHTENHETPAPLPIQIYLQQIPSAVRRSLAPIEYLQTSLLQLAARYPAAWELLESAPLLLWLAAHYWQGQLGDTVLMRSVLARRRTELLANIYGTGTVADVRFLNRLTLAEGDWSSFKLIAESLPDDRLKHCLRGWPRVPLVVLAIVRRYPELLGSRLLMWLSESPYEQTADGVAHASRIVTVWRDVMRMGHVLGFSRKQQLNALMRCRSRMMLNQLHDQWVERFNRHDMDAHGVKIAFPPPPLSGTDAIQPITCEAELLAEGRAMHHCVAGYRNDVRRGHCYIYRVLEPQRATLEIKCPQLVIGQLKLAHNEKPSEACWQAVQHWLKAALQATTTYIPDG